MENNVPELHTVKERGPGGVEKVAVERVQAEDGALFFECQASGFQLVVEALRDEAKQGPQ